MGWLWTTCYCLSLLFLRSQLWDVFRAFVPPCCLSVVKCRWRLVCTLCWLPCWLTANPTCFLSMQSISEAVPTWFPMSSTLILFRFGKSSQQSGNIYNLFKCLVFFSFVLKPPYNALCHSHASFKVFSHAAVYAVYFVMYEKSTVHPPPPLRKNAVINYVSSFRKSLEMRPLLKL